MTWIWTCPDHPVDLEDDDGFGYWCPEGEHYIPAGSFGDPDGERDLMIDDRDGIHGRA